LKDLIIAIVLIVIVGLAAAYVIKAKKNGQKCIGCPNGGCCSKKTDGSACSCGCGEQE